MHLNEPSWISGEPRSHIVYETLLSFLDSASADNSSLRALADSTLKAVCSMSTPNPSVEQYRYESRVLFATLFAIVRQIDADAAQHDYLVALVLRVRESPFPETVQQQIDPRNLDSDMNHDLCKLINVWAGLEHDAPLHPRLEDRPNDCFTIRPERPVWREQPGHYLSASQWANANAFLARLHSAAPDVLKIDVRGLWAMIEALERPLTPSELEDAIPPAVYWVVYAGRELRSNDFPYANVSYPGHNDGSTRLPWSCGPLWNGRHAFSIERWHFWMRRFKNIAERTDVSETVRAAAWRAFEAGSRLSSPEI